MFKKLFGIYISRISVQKIFLMKTRIKLYQWKLLSTEISLRPHIKIFYNISQSSCKIIVLNKKYLGWLNALGTNTYVFKQI